MDVRAPVRSLRLCTDDRAVAGVLPEISADLGVSGGRVGELVTVFSVTVAVPYGTATSRSRDHPRSRRP